jgi:hypothetical protein
MGHFNEEKKKLIVMMVEVDKKVYFNDWVKKVSI